MSGRAWRSRIAATCVAVAVVAVLSSPPPGQTEAAWTDPEAAQGTFQAITVPAPVGIDCAYNPGVLGLLLPSVTLQWKLPAGGELPEPYTIEPGFRTAGVVSSLLDGLLATVNTTRSGDVYTTKASALLATNIFGSSRNLGVRIKHPSGWTSPWVIGTATSQSLGLNGSCTFASYP